MAGWPARRPPSPGASSGRVPNEPGVTPPGITRARQVYQARGPALRLSKGALPDWSGVGGCPPSSETGEWGFPMEASMMFLDCPAYMDKTGSVRCGLPAEVEGRYLMRSTDGPLESARIRCPRGHWFNGPVESLTFGEHQDTAAEREAIARLKGSIVRRRAS